MKFTIEKTAFSNALQTVSRAISPNSPVPVLSGIKIEAADNKLVLTASDVDISIRETLDNASDQNLDLSITEEGIIVCDAKYLLDIVRKMDSDIITVEIIDGTLTQFTGAKAEFKINGFRPDDFPEIDFTQPSSTFTISALMLQQMISETSFAASSKETRPVLMGVHMTESDGKLTCTATDSYRLARKTIEVQTDPFSITVPAKSLNDAKTIFNEKDIQISIDNKKIQFRSGNKIMQSTLLDGAFPETDRLIPSSFTRTLVINRMSLIQAIDRTSFIRTDNMPVIRLQLNSREDITLSNKNQEIGESHEQLTAESYEGEPLDISFAGNYVTDAAKALSTENIRLQFTEDMKPFILTNEDGDDSVLQLVLPVRTYN